MTFATLALIAVIGLVGPLLAWRERWRVPVVVGELVAGLVLGASGTGVLHADEPIFAFLAQIGFALTMFVAGTHVPVRDPRVRAALGAGAARVLVVAGLSAAAGVGVAALVGGGHAPLWAVLMASSSAALVLPVVDSLRLGGPPVLAMTAQVAIADVAAIVALPLVVDPARAGTAALGALAVAATAVVVLVLLRAAQARGVRQRLEEHSRRRRFALELRVDLAVLFGLAALAQYTHVSVMLAGFALGLAVAGVGEPRRLARQVFALSEGFLGPLFFVWLGASLDLGALVAQPHYLLLAVTLGCGALLTHLATRVLGQPVSLGLLSAAQLGVPAAAATIGRQTGVIGPGEAAALLLGALVTVAASALGGALAARRGLVAPADDAAATDSAPTGA